MRFYQRNTVNMNNKIFIFIVIIVLTNFSFGQYLKNAGIKLSAGTSLNPHYYEYNYQAICHSGYTLIDEFKKNKLTVRPNIKIFFEFGNKRFKSSYYVSNRTILLEIYLNNKELVLNGTYIIPVIPSPHNISKADILEKTCLCRLQYLSIPVMLKEYITKINTNYYFLIGPRFDFLLKKTNEPEAYFFKKSCKNLVFGINIGVGLEKTLDENFPLGIELQFQSDFHNACKENKYKIRNSMLNFSIILRF